MPPPPVSGRATPRRAARWALASACASGVLHLAACGGYAVAPVPPVAFDTATVWIHGGSDSVRLLVEVAETEAQHEVGLSGRTSLDPGSGMLFEFDEPRSGDEGFWMWRTLVPLDVAFVDGSGVIRRILGMSLCEVEEAPEPCAGYFPGVAYSSALEVNRGWFAARGVGEGARVDVVR